MRVAQTGWMTPAASDGNVTTVPLTSVAFKEPLEPTRIPRQKPIERSVESDGVTDCPSVAP